MEPLNDKIQESMFHHDVYKVLIRYSGENVDDRYMGLELKTHEIRDLG